MANPDPKPKKTSVTPQDVREMQCMERLQRLVQRQPAVKAEIVRLQALGMGWSDIQKTFRVLLTRLNIA